MENRNSVTASTADKSGIESLYVQLIQSWNENNSDGYAALLQRTEAWLDLMAARPMAARRYSIIFHEFLLIISQRSLLLSSGKLVYYHLTQVC